MLRPSWQQVLKFDWPLGLGLILILGSLRFGAVVYGIESGNNQYLSLVFCLMIALPFVLLNGEGRKQIGWKRPRKLGLLTLLMGGGMAWLIYVLGAALYGNQLGNWFWYIGYSYPVDVYALPLAEKQTYFWVFSLIAMSFSPFGEELFYRGLVHGTFRKRLGDWGAAGVDSLAFALVHLAHFGLIHHAGQWRLLAFPAFIWVGLMLVTGLSFNLAKQLSDSIAGAIIAHMSFNVTMTYLIFFQLGPAS